MSSVYSQSSRNYNPQHLENIPLRNLNQTHQTQQREWPVYHAMQTESRRKWMTIIILAVLAFIFAISTIVLAALFGVKSSQPLQSPNNSTVSASIVTTTTSLPALVSTQTKTLPPVTQTINHTETEVSYVTTEFTKTSVLTTTATTSISVTQTKDPHDGQRCTNNKDYGGQELHDVNDDYDLLMVDALQDAVSKGLDTEGSEYMDVAMRSIFLCASSDSIELVKACVSGYDHGDDGIACNDEGAYPTHIRTATTTMTATKTPRGI